MAGTPYPASELPPPGRAWIAARNRTRLSQERLAEIVGVSVRTLRNLERPGCRDVSPAIRRVVALELYLELGYRDPFIPTEEVVFHAS
jgi:DNA-binding XRE family transcriptional regulator